jgi:hypothetical protein
VTAEPFDFGIKIAGTRLKLKAEPVDEYEGFTVYLPTPDGITGPECEVCGKDLNSYYLIRDTLHVRCADHAEGIALDFGELRIPGLVKSMKDAPVGSPRWFHLQTTRLRDQGLSLGDISKSLEERGYPLGKRQIQRHLAGDCGCKG